jgi:hypothetical protein
MPAWRCSGVAANRYAGKGRYLTGTIGVAAPRRFDHHHSASASRFTAGALGFLTLIQC